MTYEIRGNNLLICCKTFEEFESAFLQLSNEKNADEFFGILQQHCDIFRECSAIGYTKTEKEGIEEETFSEDRYYKDIIILAKYYWAGKNTSLIIADETLVCYNPRNLFKFEY